MLFSLSRERESCVEPKDGTDGPRDLLKHTAGSFGSPRGRDRLPVDLPNITHTHTHTLHTDPNWLFFQTKWRMAFLNNGGCTH